MTVKRELLKSYPMPAGGTLEVYFELPDKLQCEWPRLPPLKKDLRFYEKVIAPEIMKIMAARFGGESALWVVLK